jgi:hypothetical protein
MRNRADVVKRFSTVNVVAGFGLRGSRCANLRMGKARPPGSARNVWYESAMPVNSTHPDYDAALPAWLRARDVIAGEDAVKQAGERYLPRLESQGDTEYAAYKERGLFFNATSRTAEGYIGLIFRRPPFLKLPEEKSALGTALSQFKNDADMLGTPLVGYAKNVVHEVIAVGRAGTLIDWEGESEHRVYASLYTAEQILNWRVERINGRNIPTMIVLHEYGVRNGEGGIQESDPFVVEPMEQIRVLRLVEGSASRTGPDGAHGVARPTQQSGEGSNSTSQHGAHGVARPTQRKCVVEIWQREGQGTSHGRRKDKREWKLIETRTPLRLGKPLPLIPFVFHGPRHSQPGVEKLPLSDIITVNLDHYRLNADYKHGVHYTALPTVWVSGFDKSAQLRIGSSTAWIAESAGAAAGFLEFTGQGLTTFERAMDRDERLMAVLGSRLLEGQKKVGETAQAIELRQSGENSILGNIAVNVSASLTQALRWAYWWNSTGDSPDDVTGEQVLIELNTDFSTKGMSAQEIQAIVAAWQADAISRDTMTELFRRGEVLPEGRTLQEEVRLIGTGREEGSGQANR